MTMHHLLADGADPNETDRYGWGPLHFAVPLAGLEVVSELLAAGVDPDAQTVGGATALHLAASQATVSVVSALLSAGADPNARDDEGGKSPLHYAGWIPDENLIAGGHLLVTGRCRSGIVAGENGRQRAQPAT